jgi:Tfp pilus assembly protein PilO
MTILSRTDFSSLAILKKTNSDESILSMEAFYHTYKENKRRFGEVSERSCGHRTVQG